MKKIGGLLVFCLLVLGVIVYFERQKIIDVISPPKVTVPIYKQPTVYDLENLLEKNGIVISGIPVHINGTIQATISGMLTYFADSKDLFTQVRSLQLVLPRLKMDGKQVKEIDLRFNKVVIRY